MWVNFSNRHKVRDNCYPCHCSSTAEKTLSNHRDEMACSVMAVSLFSQLLYNVPINKVAMFTGMDVIHELNNMYFSSPRLIWLLLLSTQHVNMSSAETKAELPIWQHSLGGPASHLVAS